MTASKKDLLIVGSGLTNRQLKIFYSATPEDKIKTRVAKGGGEWKYVAGSYVKQVLNALFGVEWTFNIETSVKDAFDVAKITGQCVVKGTLTVPIGDKVITRSQFGRCDVKFKTKWDNETKSKIPLINDMTGMPEPLDFGNDLKGAGTDALKKCANELGLFMDIYSNDDFIEVTVDVGADDQKKSDIVDNLRGNNS